MAVRRFLLEVFDWFLPEISKELGHTGDFSRKCFDWFITVDIQGAGSHSILFESESVHTLEISPESV